MIKYLNIYKLILANNKLSIETQEVLFRNKTNIIDVAICLNLKIV